VSENIVSDGSYRGVVVDQSLGVQLNRGGRGSVGRGKITFGRNGGLLRALMLKEGTVHTRQKEGGMALLAGLGGHKLHFNRTIRKKKKR